MYSPLINQDPNFRLVFTAFIILVNAAIAFFFMFGLAVVSNSVTFLCNPLAISSLQIFPITVNDIILMYLKKILKNTG